MYSRKRRDSLLLCSRKSSWRPPQSWPEKRAYDVMDAYAKRFPKAVQCLENGVEDSLTFYAFPKLDAWKISSSNMIERLNREIRNRTSVVGAFPDGNSPLMLGRVRLRYVTGT